MTKPSWNPRTQRHELEFINQQADLIFLLRWDEARRAYAFDVDDAQVRKHASDWGAALDVDAAREAGALQLAKLDRERPNP